MSFRSLSVLFLALSCGVSAAVGINRFHSSAAQPEREFSDIVAAAVDIPRGVMVTREMVKLSKVPKDDAPHGAMTSIDDAVDRAVIIPLLKDDPVRDAKLASKDAGRGMAALVRKGMRAYTIMTTNVASGVAGFILPGNKVDVVLAVTDQMQGDDTGGGSATTLLQNIEILAVDQRIDAPVDNKVDPKLMASVTLLVTPDQANKLSLAQSKGTLHLSLRNDEDSQAGTTRPVSLRELRYGQERPASKKEAPKLVALPQAPRPRPIPLVIRTLRGREPGSVSLEPVAWGRN